MSAPIIKIPVHGMHIHELLNRLNECGVVEGSRFVLKFKIKKRFRLRAFRLGLFYTSHCECCGPYIMGHFRNSHRRFDFDSHFGIGYVFPQSIC